MKIVLVDFKDSFTHNIAHYLQSFGYECKVVVDGEFDLEILNNYNGIILSPGPGLPSETFMMGEIISAYYKSKPILGICLGMQGIAEFFKGKLYNMENVMHGIQIEVIITKESPLYEGIDAQFEAGLYHSWCCDISSVPELKSDAVSNKGVLMSFHHSLLPIFGIQYHPESIMTKHGKQILKNFVNLAITNTTKNKEL